MDKHQELIISGMGGQGVMVIGQLLAHAAVMEDDEVVWLPSYGPETRGGTSNCTVIVSSDEIGSPVITTPDSLVALNQESVDRFGPKVKREGVILFNASLAEAPANRSDCKIVGIPATEEAAALGSPKVANMVMLGAYVALLKPVSLDSVKAALKEVIPERNHKFLPLNNAALEKGAALVG